MSSPKYHGFHSTSQTTQSQLRLTKYYYKEFLKLKDSYYSKDLSFSSQFGAIAESTLLGLGLGLGSAAGPSCLAAANQLSSADSTVLE
jgi:hypothetical protein